MEEQTKAIRMSVIDRIAALFISPAELMRNIKHYPSAVVPLVICLAIVILYLPLTQRYTDMVFESNIQTSIETYEQMGISNPEQIIAQTQSMMHTTALITSLASIPISALLFALGMLLLGKLFKSEAAFGQYFSMYSYLLIITTLGSAVITAISLSLDTQINMLSLAVLMPESDAAGIMTAILSSFSLPNIWFTALAIVGIKIINEWTTAKSAAVGMLSFVLSVTAGAAFQFLSGMLTGA